MKITLHIGTEKTGTTSIQQALSHIRDDLASRGVLYPKLFGSENHMEIAVSSRVSNSLDELQLIEFNKFGSKDVNLYREKLMEKLTSEIHSGTFERIIISNEHCHSRLTTESSLEALALLLEPITHDIEVIVYLRRQDRLAVSLDSTRVKLGGKGDVFPDPETSAIEYFAYEKLIKRYERRFARHPIKIRIYEPKLLRNADVVEDFFHVAELGPPPDVHFEANVSLSRSQRMFLKLFNERQPLMRNGKMNPDRGPIFSAIKNTRAGPPFRPARNQARQFYSYFAEGNARIKREYFSGLERPTLFDEDFSDYPDVSDPFQLSTDEMLDFVEAIWRRRAK